MADGIVLRNSAQNLSAQQLADVRKAYAGMQAISDNRGYNYLAGLHGVPQYKCYHGEAQQPSVRGFRFFLPWHRAYLHNFELAMMDQVAGVAVPWWDWRSDAVNAGVPAAFSDPTQPDGSPNPLLQAHISYPAAGLDRDTTRFPGDPSQLPANSDINGVLGRSDYVDFSDALEDLHNQIHGWTGGRDPNDPNSFGDMGSIPTAAFDPIFWAHHSMIDRIWRIWQQQNGVDHGIPAKMLSAALDPFSLTIQDVLNVQSLGYDYATSEQSVGA